MRYGTIVKYFPDKKFGFIKPDTGQDVFFHISALGDNEPQAVIQLGQPVEYELMTRWEMKLESGGGDKKPSDRGKSEQPKAKVVGLIEKLPGASLSEFYVKAGVERHPRARKKKPTWRR